MIVVLRPVYQTVHQHPLTVAYISRDDPRTLTERAPVLQHFRHLGLDVLDVDPAAVGMTVLADLGVTQVVLDRYKMPGGRERAYTEALAGAIFVGHPPLHEDERLTVYAVEPPATAAPYPLLGALHWGPLQNPEGRAMGDHGDVLMGVERILLGEPAALHFHHLPADGQVTLTYRTLPDVPLAVLPPGGDAGAPLLTLPPAPAGQTVTLPVDAWRERVADGPGDRLTLLLHPGAPESVWIQQVGLLLP